MMAHRIFYALPIFFYGTKKEEEDIILIENLFPNGEIYNIAQNEKNVESINVTFLKSVLKKCDVMFFRSLPDGKLGGSVFNLVRYAKKKNIPVLEIGDLTEKRRI
jgi:hypothetical protein